VKDQAHGVPASDLAALAGVAPERIAELAEVGVLRPLDDGSFPSGDVHVVRLLTAFETAGVPVGALVAGTTSGRLDFASYHELHRDPGVPSDLTYGALREELDGDGMRLSALFTAFGLAEPRADGRLAADEEDHLRTWVRLLDGVDDGDLLIRVARLYGEGARRTATAALDVYEEAASRLGPDPASVPPDAYARLLAPWAEAARELPALAGWLTERHLRDAIDAFSVSTSEQILAAEGIVPVRDHAPPGIAFVDLTGYTRATRQLGDEAAAARSLRLGDLARIEAEARGGRLVKLLGDGALLQLPDAIAAVDASLGLLRAITMAGLGGGHAGVSCGPVIEREGDVYGTTVNLAARISDHAPDGEIEVSADVATAAAAAGIRCETLGPVALAGLDEVELFRVVPA
jgi:adenylate cyclase